METPGTYKIEYTVKDDAGNETKKEHKIIIYEWKMKEKTFVFSLLN